jgi:hypothetical protein
VRINWRSFDAMRLLRIFLSGAVMVQGYQDKQSSFILLGLMFLLMTLFGVGCCSGGSCFVRTKSSDNLPPTAKEEFTYEEIN